MMMMIRKACNRNHMACIRLSGLQRKSHSHSQSTHNASTSTHIVWPRAHAIVLHSVMACQQFVHCQVPALTALPGY